MPTLFKRSASPYWQIKVQRNGREFWKSTRETNKARAEARALILLNDIQDTAFGRATPAPDQWTAAWWNTYWEHRVGSVARSATHKSAYVEDLLGKWRVSQLRPSHFSGYIAARRAAGAADSTIALEGTLLRQCFKAAIEEGLLTKNPAASRLVQWPSIAIRDRVLGPAEEAWLCGVLGKDARTIIQVSLRTGMRGAEIAGLTVEQVLWEPRVCARITGKGRKRREVPVFAAGVDPLREAIGESVSGRIWFPTTTPTQAVTNLNHVIRRAWVKAGIPGSAPTTHVFRHTFATRFLQAGGDIYTLSKILGHASVTITERVYAHLLDGEITARALTVQIP